METISMTPATLMRKLLLPACTLLLAACTSVMPPLSSDNHIVPGYHRPEPGTFLLMLPPEAETDDMQAGIEILKKQLHQQLSAAGYKVAILEQGNYNSLWAEEVKAVGGIYDPVSGSLRRTESARALAYLVQRVSTETKAVLVLRPRLVLRNAELSGTGAVWDGQQRRMPVAGAGGDAMRHNGTTLGLSVELTAFTAGGERVLRTYGGASLPFMPNLFTNRNEVRTDLFAKDTELAEAVALTLAPIVGK